MTTVTEGLDVRVPGLDKLFIGGHWVDPATDRMVDVVMPSTEEVITQVADPSPADADRAVAAAREAYDRGPWPRMTPQERIEACTRLADELEARLDEMNRAWTFEAGAPKFHGDMINSGAGRMVWRYAIQQAENVVWEEKRTSIMGETLVVREPMGVVLGILTYNGPVVLMGMKIIPALLAGNCVIIKHAPESPLTSRLVAEAVEAAGLPEGVVSILPAGVETTQHLVGHPDVDMVHITAGTEIAKDVVRRTADSLTRTALELGGKSPAIILPDADLDAVMQTLPDGACGFNGQVCVALSRVLAPRSRYDEVVDRLAEAYTRINAGIGDPFDPATTRGPLAVKRAVERCEHYVKVALEEGATLVVGGKRPDHLDRGYYFEQTLLRDVDNSMRIAQEEIFGPVTVVIPYDTVDEAIDIANDTIYGLAASVYSSDEDQALAVARRIYAGGVAINLAGVSLCEPFGGYKQSGWGKECGLEGILEFTQIKQILLRGSYSEM
ncbi:aldehyde dehydrogenase [Ornithinimicrobium humiphilum]|uniref:Betaine-aldehyde dehydrogenase n=1 Tax=Ornithinimicrobium humiphilum TaxID=125288 RepID=A0A543KRT6_9MICO|nr:aldehyde dehydrogenase [Ornithinimicrobium humiphilum]TQM97788.1 betaine-aldehyde dehydrogenase [Ornithinimicrobium humiphilum]